MSLKYEPSSEPQDRPNVYEFGTPYSDIRADLTNKVPTLETTLGQMAPPKSGPSVNFKRSK